MRGPPVRPKQPDASQTGLETGTFGAKLVSLVVERSGPGCRDCHRNTNIGAAMSPRSRKKSGPTANLSSLIQRDIPRDRRQVKAGINRKKTETKPLLLSVT